MQTEGISFKKVKQNCKMILSCFAEIPRVNEEKVKVGVVGEIYVKYFPLGNNNLEQFLIDEGAEVVVPGLLDFFMYCIVSNISDIELYGLHKIRKPVLNFVFNYLQKQQNEIIELMKTAGNLHPADSHCAHHEPDKGFYGLRHKNGRGLVTARRNA